MRKIHFVDSGAFSLFNKVLQKKRNLGGKLDYTIYHSKEFWKYVDDYAAFIKKYSPCIDGYVNVDACRNPKLSWKIQKYLENEHGLSPIPVVHFGTELKWLEKYINAGYEYIGIGGRVQRLPYHPWADRVFNLICSTKDRLPVVKTHGFAMTSWRYIVRYPWKSVDSTTWRKMAYQGQILVPPYAKGEYRFDKANMVLFMDPTSKYTERKGKGRHYIHLDKHTKRHVRLWLKKIGVPWGKRNKIGDIVEEGVTNSERWRQAATIHYFLNLVATLPEWPWPFYFRGRPTLEEIGD